LVLPLSRALAQDSVGLPPNHLPGDAVNAHDLLEQQNDYIVDKTAFHTSWGNMFSVAPIVKCSKLRDTPTPDFFTQQCSAQSMSRLIKINAPFARNSYMLWNGPGFGVNHDPALNTPGSMVGTTGMTGYQIGVAFAEFGNGGTSPAGGPAPLNDMIGGVV